MSEIPQSLCELLIWQASELARGKKYAEAEAILSTFDSAEERYRASALDLLGRILVRKRKYIEAKACFQKAIALDPNNTSPRRALEYLPTCQRNRRLIRSVVFPALLLICGGAIVFVTLRHNDIVERTRASQLPGIKNNPRFSEESANTKSGEMWPEFTIGGVTTSINQNEIRIAFDMGLYVDGCEFAPDSQRLLRLVAATLNSVPERFFIIIEGHTDDLPIRSGGPYKNNYALGLERAEKVALYFRRECGLSGPILLPISMGAENPVFSNSSEATRTKNRTVSLRVIQDLPPKSGPTMGSSAS